MTHPSPSQKAAVRKTTQALTEKRAGASGIPPQQGLYDPRNEHDACGVGFVAHMPLLREDLQDLEHRGIGQLIGHRVPDLSDRAGPSGPKHAHDVELAIGEVDFGHVLASLLPAAGPACVSARAEGRSRHSAGSATP